MATRYFNGAVYTGNGFQTELFVDDGLVITAAEFQTALDKSEVDLNGRSLLPGFRDGHAHPMFAGRELHSAQISDCRNIDEIGIALAKHLTENPKITWLDAGSYDRSIPGDKTRHSLDRFISEVPVVLHADDHHTIWVNTKALEICGLMSKNLPKLATGAIDLGEDGFPSGILREFEAIALITKHAPQPTLTADVNALLAADEKLLEAGIVAVQDAWVVKGMPEVYLAAEQSLRLEYRLAFKLDPDQYSVDFDYFETVIPLFSQSSKVRPQAMKFFIDGVFGSATASVLDPYLSTSAHGDLNWSFENLVAAITRTHKLGLQSHIHAIGDGGVEFALRALATSEPGVLAPVIAHAELTNPELLVKAKALDVTLCVQPYWAQYNGMLNSCIQHLGEARTARLYAFKDMLSSGINLAFSSDWPVSSYSPIEGITVAVNRRGKSDQERHNANQAITLTDAIEAYSISVQRMFGETELNTLMPGSTFTAVELDGDLNRKDLEGSLATKVLAVYSAGSKLFPHN